MSKNDDEGELYQSELERICDRGFPWFVAAAVVGLLVLMFSGVLTP